MHEVWKNLIDYEYQVSDQGNIRRIYKNGNIKLLKKIKHPSGYLNIRLYKNNKGKNFKIHRLVAEVFIPNPENKPQVNHIDGDKHNNRVENLEYVTSSENITHAWKNKLCDRKHLLGSNNHNSTLVENEVYVIKGLLKHTSLTQKEIGSIFNVSNKVVSKIKRNIIWSHI